MGSPTELPRKRDVRDLNKLLDQFFALPECSTGGPLHVVLEDFNIEKSNLYWRDYNTQVYTHEVVLLADYIVSRLAKMKKKERAAVIAKREGWF
jgi:hypothetical protein